MTYNKKLGRNKISSEGAIAIGESLKRTENLRILNLSMQNIPILINFILGENSIGDAGTKEIAEALKYNHSLIKLNLSK